MYTSISKVRELSGFDDTTNIPDTLVKGKIMAAEGMFDGAASMRYQLPFAYHVENTLTFSGTGSGSGTMAIVINSVTYNISITSGLTASQAADLFRDAIRSATTLKSVDSIGDGAEVVVVSIEDSSDFTTANAQVNITSATTAQGISAAIGTRTERYAPMIDQIVAEIAAALLLMDNYGIEAQDTPKDGDRRMERINEILQKIQGVHQSGQVIKLFDEITKEELTYSLSSAPSYIPNTTTNDDVTNPTAYQMSINSVF